MKIVRWNLVIIFCFMQLKNATTVNWVNHVTKKSLDGTNVHQVVIFINNDVMKLENEFLSAFSRRVPVLMTNLRKLKLLGGSRALNSLKSTGSSLFVILSTDVYEEIQDNLNFISEMLPTAARPKCLLVIFQESKLQSNDEVQKILLNAWNLKYFDFTVFNPLTRNCSEILFV